MGALDAELAALGAQLAAQQQPSQAPGPGPGGGDAGGKAGGRKGGLRGVDKGRGEGRSAVGSPQGGKGAEADERGQAEEEEVLDTAPEEPPRRLSRLTKRARR